jgi:alpha-tubulin suppressor-like RCC1 family protein
VQVGTSSWSSVRAGLSSSLGIKTDTTLWAWGSNGTGQLGIGLTTSRSSPVQVSSAVTTWSVISISESIAAAISTSGGLYLWGLALANGTSVNRSSPVQLGTESWSAVADAVKNSNVIIGTDDQVLFGFLSNSIPKQICLLQTHRSCDFR